MPCHFDVAAVLLEHAERLNSCTVLHALPCSPDALLWRLHRSRSCAGNHSAESDPHGSAHLASPLTAALASSTTIYARVAPLHFFHLPLTFRCSAAAAPQARWHSRRHRWRHCRFRAACVAAYAARLARTRHIALTKRRLQQRPAAGGVPTTAAHALPAAARTTAATRTLAHTRAARAPRRCAAPQHRARTALFYAAARCLDLRPHGPSPASRSSS